MIQLKNISKHYPQGFGKTHVLRYVDLDIEKGDFVTIMGPSGAGKSTLLNILGLLESPSDGEYLFNEEPVQNMNEKKRTLFHRDHTGFVFQQYHLIDELTVYENIETPLLYKKISSSERKSRIAEILDRFQMVAKKNLFPSQLSGGQQQLVGVARAVVAQPALILADEPTGNLHSTQAHEIMQLFTELNKSDGITIVQVTHSDEMAAYSKRIVTLLDGKISG